jgi:hypothetical protein
MVWDPIVPRSTLVLDDGAVASLVSGAGGHEYLTNVGDLDGDGHPDVAACDGGGGAVFAGPIAGDLVLLHFGGANLPQVHGTVIWGLPDLNGDGQPELFGFWETPPDRIPEFPSKGVWVVLLSPFALPIDLAEGIPLEAYYDDNTFDPFPVDLDGDGIADLADTSPTNDIQIWFGADLVAAWNARH